MSGEGTKGGREAGIPAGGRGKIWLSRAEGLGAGRPEAQGVGGRGCNGIGRRQLGGRGSQVCPHLAGAYANLAWQCKQSSPTVKDLDRSVPSLLHDTSALLLSQHT